MSVRIIPRIYEDVRASISNGDIAVCTPVSFWGRQIALHTHTRYSHATMLGWAGHTLMVGETREKRDARLIDARSEFANWPGIYDVFSVRTQYNLDHCYWWPHYDGDKAWDFVCHAAGSKYGWNHITRVCSRRVLGARWIAPIPNSYSPRWPRDCSALVHRAIVYADGPMVADHDCDVIPGDLADPRYFEYRFTIFETEKQIEHFYGRARRWPALLWRGKS